MIMLVICDMSLGIRLGLCLTWGDFQATSGRCQAPDRKGANCPEVGISPFELVAVLFLIPLECPKREDRNVLLTDTCLLYKTACCARMLLSYLNDKVCHRQGQGGYSVEVWPFSLGDPFPSRDLRLFNCFPVAIPTTFNHSKKHSLS